MKIQFELKVVENQRCLVRNPRRVPESWEPGTCVKVTVDVSESGHCNAMYRVRMDRKLNTKPGSKHGYDKFFDVHGFDIIPMPMVTTSIARFDESVPFTNTESYPT